VARGDEVYLNPGGNEDDDDVDAERQSEEGGSLHCYAHFPLLRPRL